MTSILFNAIAAKHGGALVVHKAMLTSIDFAKLNVKAFVVTNSDLAELELNFKEKPAISVVRLPSFLKSIAVYIQPLLILYYATKFDSVLVISQNVLIPFVAIPQMIYHINVFNFLPNDGLRGKIALAKQKLRQRASKKALLKANVNVFESKYLQRLAKEIVPLPRNEHVVYIGIDELGFKQKSDIVGHKNREPTLVAVSSQNPHKRNHQLLQILNVLYAKRPDINWTVKLYGSIKEIRLPAELDPSLTSMEKHIQFLGYATQDQISTTLDTSLCLVCNSKIESFCTVALEAMKRGTPALVSPHTSMPESVGDAGFVYDKDSPEQAAIEVINLFEDNSYFLGRAHKSLEHSMAMTWHKAGTSFSQIIKNYLL